MTIVEDWKWGVSYARNSIQPETSFKLLVSHITREKKMHQSLSLFPSREGHGTLFRLKTIVTCVLHLMMFICKAIINHSSKRQILEFPAVFFPQQFLSGLIIFFKFSTFNMNLNVIFLTSPPSCQKSNIIVHFEVAHYVTI